MATNEKVSRRAFFAAGAGLAAGAAVSAPRRLEGLPRLRVTGLDLLPVRATERTVWLIVRLRTDGGLTGLGEGSDAFGFANTTNQDAARMESELRRFFGLIDGKSPLDMGAYRQRGERLVTKGNLLSATAYSAIVVPIPAASISTATALARHRLRPRVADLSCANNLVSPSRGFAGRPGWIAFTVPPRGRGSWGVGVGS